jgi:YegS/Rv2252/BmrU family lipid kinase
MRVKVILNPWADRGKSEPNKEAIPRLAAPYGPVDLVVTRAPGHAKQLAAEAAAADYDVIVAAGGDGTIHEVVNGLVQGGKAESRLGVLPLGSGNDFAYALKIPTRLEEAIERIFTGTPRAVDLARIEDDHGRFLIAHNNAGVGFDATIGIETKNITRVHGFAAYMLATLRTIAFYYQAPLLRLRFDHEAVEQRALLLGIGVGPRAGGGFLLTPAAVHTDDRLDSCLVNPVGRLTMLSLLSAVMKGQHVKSRHVKMRANRNIRVESVEGTPLPVHVDGEIFAYPRDNVRQISFSSLPAAIEVMA